MKYSRETLTRLSQSSIELFQQANQELLNRLVSGKELSLAESNYICNSLTLFRSDSEDAPNLNPYDYIACEEALFRGKYLVYFKDLDGLSEVRDSKGPIPETQKRIDTDFLEQQYHKWQLIISKDNHQEALLNHIASETKHHVKANDSYGRKVGFGFFRREHLKKSLILHGKYLYLQVKEYYQELGTSEQEIAYVKKIIIDGYFYIHTLFRHYASHLKEHQSEKSYHFLEEINFKTLPQFAVDIIQLYFNIIGTQDFDERRIYFKLKSLPYALWFRPMARYLAGNVKQEILRLQTFYPVEEIRELQKVRNQKEVVVDGNLSFLI